MAKNWQRLMGQMSPDVRALNGLDLPKTRQQVKRSGPAQPSPLEIRASSVLEVFCAATGWEKPEAEVRFWPGRRHKFDFAWPGRKIAVEVEGGTYSNGRHTRGKGYEGDCEKYNEAARLGWQVYRFTGGMVKDGRMLETMMKVAGATQ